MIPTLTATSIKKAISQLDIHKIHKTHHQSTNSIPKHISNQIYSTIEPTINKEYKIAKAIRRQSNQRKQMLKRKTSK